MDAGAQISLFTWTSTGAQISLVPGWEVPDA
jgi:hypothetical protein